MAKQKRKGKKDNTNWTVIALLALLFLAIVAVYLYTNGSGVTGGGGPNGGDDGGDTPEGNVTDCDDYDIAGEFREEFTDAVIDGAKASCQGMWGTWYETEHILLCDFNAVIEQDCNGVEMTNAKNLCVGMGAQWYCDIAHGVVGCDCNHHFDDVAGPCESAGVVPYEYMDLCQEYTCEDTGDKCMWYPTSESAGQCYCMDFTCGYFFEGGEIVCDGVCEEGGVCTEYENPLKIWWPEPMDCYCDRPEGDGQPVQCSDSDGGANPYLFGVCTDWSGSYSDTCASTRAVQEYYCGEQGICETTQIGCITPYYCMNGVCVSAPQ